jgi:hypothetical protein
MTHFNRPDRTRPRRLVPLAALVGLALLAGCGPGNENTLTGKVTLNGNEPLPGGRISLRPEGGEKSGANYAGDIKQDGTFTIMNVPAGAMVVTIETESINPEKSTDYTKNPKNPPPPGAPSPGPSAAPVGTYKQIDPKYGSPASSGLRWDIKKEGTKKDFNVTGP